MGFSILGLIAIGVLVAIIIVIALASSRNGNEKKDE